MRANRTKCSVAGLLELKIPQIQAKIETNTTNMTNRAKNYHNKVTRAENPKMRAESPTSESF